MPTDLHRDELRRMIEAGAQVVEVLPRPEYDEQHLAGAISLPLKELDAQSARRLRADEPVVVYCWDYQ